MAGGMSSLFGALLGLSLSFAPSGSTADVHLLEFEAPLDLRHTRRASSAVHRRLGLFGSVAAARDARLDSPDAPPLVAAFDPLVEEVLALVLGGLPVLTVDPFSPQAMVEVYGTF